MKKNILPLLLFTILLGCSGQKETVTVPAPSIFDFTSTINLEGLKADLTVLSHDSLEGRNTGSEGEAKAAAFLANKYERLGLEPVGDNGTYFQHLELNRPIPEGYNYQVFSKKEVLFDESEYNAEALGNFRTWWAGKGNSRGEIVFVGYGIKKDGIDQYPDAAKGKWLLAFFDRANYSTIQQQVIEKEALGMILIMSTEDSYFIRQATHSETHFGNSQDDFGNPGDFSLKYLENEFINKTPVHMVKPSFVSTMLGLENTSELAALAYETKSSPNIFKARSIGYELSYNQYVQQKVVSSKNIVAFIEGSNPQLKDEVIVLSSHYDHVGIGRPDSTGDAIYNGADDDGSGTVGILHTAQALMSAKKAGAGPERSVLILHVTGEEKGLLGSRYYSDHPIYPIEKTVANLNLDMIGRRDFENPENGDYIYVIGGKIISSGLNTMLEEANLESVNITLSDRYNDLEDPNQFYRRSDHWNFGRLGVPFVFFFNGVHEDYHRPSDEIDKIDFEALRKRTQLIFTTTAKIANATERPKVDNEQFIKKTQEQPR